MPARSRGPTPGRVPLRGDLAHIALAGRYFVPHYAVPQPRTVVPGGAPLLAAPRDGVRGARATLLAGDSFDVLDIAGGWAWGCLSLEGPGRLRPRSTGSSRLP